jgi:putative DNA-invertase from lambdoid prophage Rac
MQHNQQFLLLLKHLYRNTHASPIKIKLATLCMECNVPIKAGLFYILEDMQIISIDDTTKEIRYIYEQEPTLKLAELVHKNHTAYGKKEYTFKAKTNEGEVILPKTYVYLRVSTDKQDLESQKVGIMEFCRIRGLHIDEVYEDYAVSGKKSWVDRKVAQIFKICRPNDNIVVGELSRLGRSIFDIVDFAGKAMAKKVNIFAVKEKFVLENNFQSKMYLMMLGLAAELERDLISQRTKEGLVQRVKAGVVLGRKRGSTSEKSVLDNVKDQVIELWKQGHPVTYIANKFNTHRNTVTKLLSKVDSFDSDEDFKKSSFVETAIKLYKKGKRISQISRQLQISNNAIKKCLEASDMLDYHKRIVETNKDKIMEDYQDGIPMKHIAQKLETTDNIIKKFLVNNGCFQPRKSVVSIHGDAILECAKNGGKLYDIAKEFNSDGVTIRKFLASRGIIVPTANAGAHKGSGKRKLEGKNDQIKNSLQQGLALTTVAKIMEVGVDTLKRYIEANDLYAGRYKKQEPKITE